MSVSQEMFFKSITLKHYIQVLNNMHKHNLNKLYFLCTLWLSGPLLRTLLTPNKASNIALTASAAGFGLYCF